MTLGQLNMHGENSENWPYCFTQNQVQLLKAKHVAKCLFNYCYYFLSVLQFELFLFTCLFELDGLFFFFLLCPVCCYAYPMNSSIQILTFSIQEFPFGLVNLINIARNWAVVWFCWSYNYPERTKGFKFFSYHLEFRVWADHLGGLSQSALPHLKTPFHSCALERFLFVHLL